MRYFAYGSNMLTARLRRRVPSARPIGTAELRGYRLPWHKRSSNGSGKCNGAWTGRSDDALIAVLYDLHAEEIPLLDEAEGRGRGYERVVVRVHTNERELDAITYLANETATDEELQPYTWYRDLVVAGPREHGLDGAYVSKLIQTPSAEDPDQVRERAARGILALAHDKNDAVSRASRP
jgi:gamma-glutamylcyclotransferase